MIWRALSLGLVLFAMEIAGSETNVAPVVPVSEDISQFTTQFENRVDLDGDGAYDSYWNIASSNNVCTLSLFDIASKRKLWSSVIKDCLSFSKPPIFYRTSFMGDAKKDFSIVIKPASGSGFKLLVGDGATGELRDFSFDLGNASRDSITRTNGTAVVDFKISKYPGAALFVRSTGGGSDQRGHLFYFPAKSHSFIDIAEDPAVINKKLFYGYPFPGVDIAGFLGKQNLYTAIYNNFNSDLLHCAPFKASEAPGECGVPDGDNPTSEYWNKGNGHFLDKVAVGDADQDGADDLLLTYLWRSTVFPARPKGQPRFLGAPQYDNYYNPQNDSSGCHSGRHYGLSALVKTDLSRFLSTVDIAGTPVGQFSDPYQNVSRNIAVIKTDHHATLPTYQRTLAWNIPMGTTIPGCASSNLYNNAIHYPSDGLIRDAAGKALHVHVNRWTQIAPAKTSCAIHDIKCYTNELLSQSGYWSWEVRRITDGRGVQTIKNIYVWDSIRIPGSADIWILYSSNATSWNLGEHRSDLAMARLNASTLAITHHQTIPISARPFMKTQHWQSTEESVSSNWPATRLFTLPRANLHSSFVLNVPSGNVIFSFDGSKWASNSTLPALLLPAPIPTKGTREVRAKE